MHQRERFPLPCLAVAIIAAGLGLVVLWQTLQAFQAAGLPSDFANKDFANYWMAGRLVLDGQWMDLFGPHGAYFSHLTDVFGTDYPRHNWSYPPHYLLFVWPLGLLAYKPAMVVFLVLTGMFYVWALRVFARDARGLALVAAAPWAVFNVWTAQNGFLFAGLALAALAFRDSRPVLAGIMLGLLTTKPQLGILFPFLLLAEQRWRVIASATCTTLLLVAGSALVLGADAWTGYLREVVPFQAAVMRALDGDFVHMLPSVFGALRTWGVDAALAGHCIVALPVAVVAVAAFWRVPDTRWRSVILLVATFLVSPYAQIYDLGMAMAGIAVIVAAQGHERGGDRLFAWLLALGMLLPVFMIPLGRLGVPVAPLVLITVFAVTLVRAGYWSRCAWFGIRERPVQT